MCILVSLCCVRWYWFNSIDRICLIIAKELLPHREYPRRSVKASSATRSFVSSSRALKEVSKCSDETERDEEGMDQRLHGQELHGDIHTGQDKNYKANKEMVMIFTCGKCDVRSVKSFSKVAYTSGVVLVECPGCHARHLIADHLGWFGEKGNVEDFVKAKGHVVKTQQVDGTVELTPEQVLGDSKLAQVIDECEP